MHFYRWVELYQNKLYVFLWNRFAMCIIGSVHIHIGDGDCLCFSVSSLKPWSAAVVGFFLLFIALETVMKLIDTLKSCHLWWLRRCCPNVFQELISLCKKGLLAARDVLFVLLALLDYISPRICWCNSIHLFPHKEENNKFGPAPRH